jgi:hypothetical protein
MRAFLIHAEIIGLYLVSRTTSGRSLRWRMQTESMITCPKCSHQATEQMPTDARQFFYDCKGCGESYLPAFRIH